jgi:hypothetical protein
MIKLVRESLYINFTEDSDPVNDMGIGLKTSIRNWLKNMGVRNYTLRSNMYIIDVNGNVKLSDKSIEKIPNYIKFNRINGGFHCNNTGLTSLKGTPVSISGSFLCYNNDLTDLQYSPEFVGGLYSVSHSNLTSLRGIENCKVRDLMVAGNKLTTLQYIPKRISGFLNICNNPLTTLQYFPEYIERDIFYTESKLVNKISIQKKCEVKGRLLAA